MAEAVVEENRPSSAGAQRPKRRARVNAKRKSALSLDSQDEENKRKRTFDNFYTFCSFVLEYEEKLASESGEEKLPLAPPINNHNMMVSESRNKPPLAAPHSPINSAGESSSSASSSESSSAGSEASDGGPGSPISSVGDGVVEEYTSDDESWNLVTCFCRRPFAGRPMIECSKCETWVHLFCAKIRKDHVPDIYVCPACVKAS